MSKDLWKDDFVQFARLIAEAEAAGAFTPDVLEEMSESMDLNMSDIYSVIDKAQTKFDEIKSNL